jgi:integrase
VSAIGEHQLSDITPLSVDAYISQRATVVKPATANRDVVVLQHMFVKAMAWGKTLSNPVAHIKPLQAHNRWLRYLSHEEIARLLDVAGETLHPVLITALHTGLRRGELFHLIWQDIVSSGG